MNAIAWRQARALFWTAVTAAFLLVLLFLAGVLTLPGVPPPTLDLSAYRDWVFIVLILLATKALLEGLRPVFHAALKSHVRYEADIFAHFKLVSYVVWATAFALVIYLLFGATGAGQNGLLSLGLVSAALVYVMQEPLLNFVGWMILVTLRLYKLGDRIEVNGVRGYVVGVSPMNTTVREFGGTSQADVHTGRFATIPNSQVLRGNVINATKDTPFVWDQITITVSYRSDARAAEDILLQAASEIVAPMMEENRERLRDKYEFADLREYVTEDPTVLWSLRDPGIDLTLVYFCPVFERAKYRTELVKRVLDLLTERKDVLIVGSVPAVAPVAVPLAR